MPKSKWFDRRLFLMPLACLLIAAVPAGAETGKRRLWKTSVAVLTAATLTDAASSWNRPEANGLLRGESGRFGYKGIAIKGALAGSTILFQHFLLKKSPGAARAAAWTNFTMAGGLAGAAAYNYASHAKPRYAPGTPR